MDKYQRVMNLTDRQFWLEYWENKKNLIVEVNSRILFADVFEALLQKYPIKNALEIGGFPGQFSVYLNKYLQVKSIVLDYVIHKGILSEIAKLNEIESLSFIEGDVFTLQVDQQFDLVFSNGLIEHFEKTEEILQAHIKFIASNGVLFVSLPNFRGINGWFQRNFDKENYSKHYIQSMDLDYLSVLCKNLNLKNVEVQYYGTFMIWLENYETQNLLSKTFFLLVKYFFKIALKIIPLKGRFFSPFIVLTAQKWKS